MGKPSAGLLRRIKLTLTERDLEDDRRLALQLMEIVAKVGGLKGYPQAPLLDANDARTEFGSNFDCLNCGDETLNGRVYCDEFCRQIAKHVRYVRGCATDGRIWQPDVQSAIGTRLLTLTGGGYPEKERKIAKATRLAVLARDRERCTVCGEAAHEIDHIDGNSCDLANLRTVCNRCNRRSAFAKAREATPDEAQAIKIINLDIAIRVASPMPLYSCDHNEWKNVERIIWSSRFRHWRELGLDGGDETA